MFLVVLGMMVPTMARELSEGEVLRALQGYPILVVEVWSPTRVRIVDVLRGDHPAREVAEATWEKPHDPRRRVLEPVVGRRMIVVADTSPGGELRILAFARYFDDPQRRDWVRKEIREGCHCDDSR